MTEDGHLLKYNFGIKSSCFYFYKHLTMPNRTRGKNKKKHFWQHQQKQQAFSGQQEIVYKAAEIPFEKNIHQQLSEDVFR